MGDITNNFSYYEFRPKGTPRTWKPEFKLQELMIIEMAENLQIVRNALPQTMTINSGVRVPSDYNRLLLAGYYPSPTSDHFYANAVPIELTNTKRKLFGSYYSYSVGAADVKINGNYSDLFNLAIKLNIEEKVYFGQIILESSPRGSMWIHFGNDPYKFFSAFMCPLITRTTYLTTTDGGKSYLKVSDEYMQGLAVA